MAHLRLTDSFMKRLGRATSNSTETKNGTDEKIEHDIGTNWQCASALGITTRIIARSIFPAFGKFMGSPGANYSPCHICINICSSYLPQTVTSKWGLVMAAVALVTLTG
ncbi:unnamed protein product [Brugia pahangi]|uniref:DUF1737 domain-containing protein n=1 Tax=Brugia pahangi TaxID=6280 RepID=A0A0N4TVP6_BRUPA|nr:unnamed protein product [Brugia pahangi]